MTARGQNRPNEKHRPNDCFVIRKRTLAKDDMNGCFWPISVVPIQSSRMTESGQSATPCVPIETIRYWGESGRRKSMFLARRDFKMRKSGFRA